VLAASNSAHVFQLLLFIHSELFLYLCLQFLILVLIFSFCFSPFPDYCVSSDIHFFFFCDLTDPIVSLATSSSTVLVPFLGYVIKNTVQVWQRAVEGLGLGIHSPEVDQEAAPQSGFLRRNTEEFQRDVLSLMIQSEKNLLNSNIKDTSPIVSFAISPPHVSIIR